MAGIHKTWDEVHADPKAHIYFDKAVSSEFAHEVQEIISPNSVLLDIGCGTAKDSLFFAEHGHKTLATDVSTHAIARANAYLKHPNLTFQALDISNPLPFAENSFDVLYARLSLHYFTNEITKQIFAELVRVVKANGYLCFLCKTIKDPIYGEGNEIEKHVFMQNGIIRHFFTENYVNELLGNNYEIIVFESGNQAFYDYDSSYIKVIAKKK